MNIEQFAVELLSKITSYPGDRVVRGSLKVNMLDPTIDALNKFKDMVIAEYLYNQKSAVESAKAKPIIKKVKEDANITSTNK